MPNASARHISAVRQFNRFYTREIGALREGLLDSEFTLAEARILYELGQADTTAAAMGEQLAGEFAFDPETLEQLRLDAGYLSRMLRRFEQRGLIARKASATDRRARRIALTARGRAAFRRIDKASRREIEEMLARLPPDGQQALVGAMQAVERLLDGRAESATKVALRTHRDGDWGFIVQQHGTLYAREFGWNQRFEAMVAQIVGDIARNFDPTRERCWIAEIGGERVGSVCLVRKSARVAKLRLLLLDPAARGCGLGRRLVSECTAFARSVGYRKIVLWTQSSLAPARHLYKEAGYRLVSSEPNDEFGKKLVAENWELDVADE